MNRVLPAIAIALLGGCPLLHGSAAAAPDAQPLAWRVKLGTPAPGSDYAMATLGDTVIRFGGGRSLGITWRWDGAAWERLAPAASPPARTGHAMTTLGDKIILFGGRTTSRQEYLNDTWQFNGTTWTQLYAPGPSPIPRAGHAMATLSGTVVLFGGDFGQYSLDDTWIWNGTTWRAVEKQAGPAGLAGHSMATLGEQIILFGGRANVFSTPLGETWSWNGVAWKQLFPASSPSPRTTHLMSTVGDRIVVFGGRGIVYEGNGVETVVDLADTWEWNGAVWTERRALSSPSPSGGARRAMAARRGELVMYAAPEIPDCAGDSWTWDGTNWHRHPGSLASPPAVHGYATAMLDGKILVFGPSCSGNSEDTWSWDGGSWTAMNPPSRPPQRSRPAIATLAGKVVLFGGFATPDEVNPFGASDPKAPTTSLVDTWTWDGATWTEMTSTSRPSPRGAAAMAAGPGGAILFGGLTDNRVSLAETWKWDGQTWTELEPITRPTPRSHHVMATWGDKIILHGGRDQSGQPLGDTWAWDGTNWAELAPILSPSPREGHALAVLGDKLVLFGGEGSFFRGAWTEGRILDDLWTWDGTSWTELPSTAGPGVSHPRARRDAVLATRGDQVFLHGGYTRDSEGAIVFSDSWTFAGGTWTRLGSAPSAPIYRTAHAMAASTSGVVLFGGGDENFTSAYGDTWVWENDAWNQRELPIAPPRRRDHAMAALGDTVVLFGGTDLLTPVLGDTWLWNGAEWRQVDPPVSPPGRINHAMAALGGDVILFGGDSGIGPVNETWAWNGTTWRKLAPLTSPPARTMFAMASSGTEIVINGGFGILGQTLGDTWTWDGKTWIEQTPTRAPPARAAHAMAPLGDGVLLFGGNSGYTVFGDAWLWRGTTWELLRSPLAPPPRARPAMTTWNQELVLFEGDPSGDTWLATYENPTLPPPPADGGCDCAVGRRSGGLAGACRPSGVAPTLLAVALLAASASRRRRRR